VVVVIVPEGPIRVAAPGTPLDILKVAVTLCAALIVTVQVPVPEHPPPDHPVKVDPVLADAVSITDVPGLYEAVPVFPLQDNVPVLGVTLPDPVPAFVTDN
jgi:hypothetical protein